MEEQEDKSLKGIMSISGMGGLYKIKATTKSGYIVESLIDNKKIPVSANQRVSMLDDITVFTQDGDIPLKRVLKNLQEKEKEGKTYDAKADNDQLKKSFTEVQPDFDQDRVYASDIKKIFSWYMLLKDNYTFEEEEKEISTEVEEKAGNKSPEEEKGKKPASKAKKKSTSKVENEGQKSSAESKPKKAPAARKKDPAASSKGKK